ncbi:hypothetical protein [Ignicoccus hospitalis]|uniref:Uncharacterized protein n=1 Tax=Ignicoccus hospitalis (strain KIN4/I / DSM 18386 / JCM 14125) TaxID=453591 RepID=A8A9D7_IGNH4|nr:hypothetical protein [Ignicoccus hospitalis]ABU81539.1 hypothetical protein Igni_0356 [Ignicoccus hospitalis KIN4/I]HIH90474.1 hypothetical protein [Desulfurococcaceae archaeon]
MRPVYAQGYYFLIPLKNSWRVHEVVNYYYYDEEGEMSELLHKPSEYEEEVYRAWEVMQEELEKEEVMINGVKTVPKVNWASLNFLAFAELPYYTFLIEFEGPSREGTNCFENRFEDWVAEYDYEAFWYLPPGYRFSEVQTSCEYEVSEDGRALGIWCRKGEEVRGYERICWRST